MTVEILRAANSAAYANLSQIVTVREALARLGTAQVLALAVAAGARPHFQANIPEYNLNDGALWHHSVAAAVAAEIAPRFCRQEIPPEGFTAALLHDVGKILMGRHLDSEVLRLIAEAKKNKGLSQLEAESLFLGVHHGQLGGLIVEHWQLPSTIVTSTIYHHTPAEGHHVICDFTYLANETAKRIEAGFEGFRFHLEISPDVAQRLGIESSRLDEYCAAVSARFRNVSLRYCLV
jgi:HD-like signal output (HDOD) protein